MNILEYIKQVLHKIEHYDQLKYSYESLQDEVSETNQELADMEEDYAKLEDKYEALKETVKKLKEDDKLDLLDLKSYYENKYDDKPYTYNFDGKGKKNVKYALRVKDASKLKETVKGISDKYDCSTPTKCVKAVMLWAIKSKWRYVYDKVDYWTSADKSIKLMHGDCDDLAILMHNLIYYLFELKGFSEHYWRLKFATGKLLGEGGHAFNIWLGDSGEWYVVESTYDLLGSFKKTWLKTPVKNNNLYQSFWGFARRDKSWIGLMSSLEPHRRGE